eukprot:PhF_6_TR35206/c0_g1_i1/m.51265
MPSNKEQRLEDELVFYAAYHSHPLNKLVHVIFVPMILITAGVGLQSILDYGTVDVFGFQIALNFPTALIAFYVLYYFTLDVTSAVLWTIFQALPILALVGCSCVRNHPHAILLAWVGHALSWFFQVSIGHGIFEKKKPALLDSLGQAFLTAPLFVLLETIMPLGFKSELHKRVTVRAAKLRAESDKKQ